MVGVVVEPDPAEVLEQLVAVERDGCDAAELNLSALPAGGTLDLDVGSAAGQGLLVSTACRRRDFMAAYGLDSAALDVLDDDARMAAQLAWLDHGSVALDMELDTFDPDPAPPPGSQDAAIAASRLGAAHELSRDSQAIRRQMDLARSVHERGGQLLGSCHTGRRQTADQLVEIVAVAHERGADLVKIVAPCTDEHDLCSFIDASARLVAQDAPPFILIGTGAWAALTRTVGTNLGSAWAYVRPTAGRWTYPEQPTAEGLRMLSRIIDWRVPDAAGKAAS